MDISASEPDRSNRQDKTRKRVYVGLVALGAFLIVAWLGVKGWRLYRIAQSLQAHQVAAESLLEGGITEVDPEAAEDLVMAVRQDVVAVNAELKPFVGLAQYFGWLPKIGPVLREAKPLLEMADAGSEAAAYAVRGLKPALVLLQEDSHGESLLSSLLPVLEEAEPDLAHANAALDRALQARSAIGDTDDLPWRVTTMLEEIDNKAFLADGLKFLMVMPEFLGVDGPRRYVIVAQNEDEIRATGGFVTGAGMLTVNDGRIEELSFQDANSVDDWRNKPYDFPPQPLYDLMGLELFLFRDANFWPDFPTSAEQALALYEYGQDVSPPDGVIAVDQHFVATLVGLTGPVVVPELDATIAPDQVIPALRSAWARPEGQSVGEWLGSRKDFLGPFARAIKERLFANLGSLDMVHAAEVTTTAIREKHLQVYSRDPEVASVLREIGWTAELAGEGNHDLLMVVDSNVGYNKVSTIVDESIRYEVRLRKDGSGDSVTTIQYTHGLPATDAPCVQGVSYDSEVTYDRLASGCLWNYVRVYAPAGSTLEAASEHRIPAGAEVIGRSWSGNGKTVDDDPSGLAVFSNYFVLPQGNALSVQFNYSLPVIVAGEDGYHRYELSVFKQAGADAQPLEVVVRLPEGSEFVSAQPEGATIEGELVTLRSTLVADTTFVVTYRQVPGN